MKRYLWVVERKDGLVWKPTLIVAETKGRALDEINGFIAYRNVEYRVKKYTPAE